MSGFGEEHAAAANGRALADPIVLPYSAPPVPARFVARPNRFVVHAILDAGGHEVVAHLADPGRLRDLLLTGCRVWLVPAANPDRRTRWSVVLVESPAGDLVSVDTTLPNRLVAAALAAEALPELAGWRLDRAEVTVPYGRLDFVLVNDGGGHLALEVKSATLVTDGLARFPDAVTARGTRHMRGLAELAGQPGWQAAVLFVAQRADVTAITAAPEIDPTFAAALAAARAAGVVALGRRCQVGLGGVALGPPVPVLATPAHMGAGAGAGSARAPGGQG
jgi:sugar fermentation stimulation protein A